MALMIEFESDDEAITWMRDVIRVLREARERQAIAEMEETLSSPSDPPGVPMPGHCHPYYANRRDVIVAWLNGVTPFSRYALNIPKAPPIRSLFKTEPLGRIEPLSNRMTTLTRREAWWPAPYVGRPYVYVWSVGVDEYGRAVAGDVTDRPYVPEHHIGRSLVEPRP